MTNQAQAKRQPILILALILALLPIFTLTSMSTSAATGPIDLLEGKLGIDFGIDKWIEPGGTRFAESADKLFDGTSTDPIDPSILTKYFANSNHDEDGINIVFDFGIAGSRFEGIGATIRGVQLASADAEGRDPTAWTLEGTNDTTTAWTLIHSSNETETASTLPTERDTNYEATMFPTSEPFKYFRFIVTATRAGGIGNSNSALSSLRFFGGPTVIRTQADLVAIGTDETTLSGDYVLGNDIVLNEIEPDSGYYVGDGMVFTTFTGNFDGANHTISNLLGTLFQVVGDGGMQTTISHLNLVTNEIGLPSSFTGILTEELSELSLVNDVHVSGKLVQGEECPVGGIAGRGRSNSSIENSSADVTIELGATNDDVGGLIGSTSGNISNSFAKVNISGDAAGKIGGLVGTAEQGSTIINSASSGTINGGGTNQGTYFGGLVGYSQGSTVTKSASSVQINTGQDSIVGGLVGWAENSPDDSTSTLISNSFASGAVTNQGDKAGGLIGYIDKGTVSNCVATGNVSGNVNVGGLIGYAESSEVMGSSASGNISGNSFVGGLIGALASNAHASVGNSSATGDVTGVNEFPVNIGGFIGFVDGNNASVSNVSSMGSIDAPFGQYIGGLIGQIGPSSTSILNRSSSSGTVTAISGFQIGGLVGENHAPMSNGKAIGAVTAIGGTDVGGLVGYTDSDLSHTIFEEGVVTGENNVGTLAGRAEPDHIWYSKATGTSVNTSDQTKNDRLEGFSNYHSDDTDGVPGLESLVETRTIMVQLNFDFTDPLPWAQSASINSNQPYLRALLGTGFYIESAPTPSITPSTQSVSAIAKTRITPTTAFTPVNLTSPVYTVLPALPVGLEISPTTGIISGTPTSASPSTSYVVTATSGAQSATATVTLVVTAAPSVAVVIPDPPQTSKVISATSEVNENSNGEEIIVLGDFIASISNVAINGKALNSSDWKQEASKLVIKYVTNSSSKLSIQIWNGQAPLLSAIDVVINVKKVEPVAKPSEAPVATPVITPTPKPIEETGVKKAVVKKKTIVCYKGKKSKKVKAVKPVCPKGYKAKK